MYWLYAGVLFGILDIFLLQRDYRFERRFGSKFPLVWRAFMHTSPPDYAARFYFWQIWAFWLVIDATWVGVGLAELAGY